MSAEHGEPEGTSSPRDPTRARESLLSGGLKGVALVTLATVALAAGGALIALIVALLY